ncbi:MAG: lipase family protein, partial [Verrucomicrobiota bacterium]
QQAQLLINASLEAYNAFDKNQPSVFQADKVTAPKGFEPVDHWTGVDTGLAKKRSLEIYGVVFRSGDAPYTYIFAFRGTASPLDILDDLGATHKAFKPYDDEATVPHPVKVEAGFFDIYYKRHEKTPSMQHQVFALLDRYQQSDKPIGRLLITGHSLGASLATLFTLDVALSRPDLNAVCYNYASPRTGNAHFVQFYEEQPAQLNPTTKTVRIQNLYDKVPCVPPENLGYSHTSKAFLVAFYKDSFKGQDGIIDCHSSLNYNAAINCAAEGSNGQCLNDKLFVPGNNYNIISKTPDPKKVCQIF